MSKFGNLKQARSEMHAEIPTLDPHTQPANPPATQLRSQSATQPVKKSNAKRNDPEYTQASAYVRRNTLTATKKKLLDQGDREFSDLVEELLLRWIKE